MARTFYVVKIEGKLNTSNKAAAFMRKALGIKNRLGYGDGRFCAGYVVIDEQSLNRSYYRIYRYQSLDVLRNENLIFLNGDIEYIGSI